MDPVLSRVELPWEVRQCTRGHSVGPVMGWYHGLQRSPVLSRAADADRVPEPLLGGSQGDAHTQGAVVDLNEN